MSEYNDYNWSDGELTDAHECFMQPIINMLPKDGSAILDVGCGNGSFANYLIDRGYNVFGTDASFSGINIANKTNKGRFYIQDLSSDDLPVELIDINFKTIISTEVVEHLYNPRKYINFCSSILQKNGGGTFILSTPYHGYFKNLVLSLFNAWDKHFTALWDGGHIKFWSYKTIKALLQESKFKVVEFVGCGRFHYLWKSMVIKSTISK